MSPTPTETELKVKPADKWYERCLKLMARVDWRGLALVLAALAGIGGAIWNRLDSIVERALAARTQQGVYEVLATKIDDISLRLASLEATHVPTPAVPAPTPAAPDEPVPGSKSGRVPSSMRPPDAAVVMIDAVPEVTYKAARLPSFQTIQRRAQDDDLPIAEAAPSEGPN